MASTEAKLFQLQKIKSQSPPAWASQSYRRTSGFTTSKYKKRDGNTVQLQNMLIFLQ